MILHGHHFQRKSDGSAYFVNVGLHPLFLTRGLLEEVDCALRTRLGSIDHRNGMDQAELEKAVQEAIDFTHSVCVVSYRIFEHRS